MPHPSLMMTIGFRALSDEEEKRYEGWSETGRPNCFCVIRLHNEVWQELPIYGAADEERREEIMSKVVALLHVLFGPMVKHVEVHQLAGLQDPARH